MSDVTWADVEARFLALRCPAPPTPSPPEDDAIRARWIELKCPDVPTEPVEDLEEILAREDQREKDQAKAAGKPDYNKYGVQKPFACQFCSQRFFTFDRMNEHQSNCFRRDAKKAKKAMPKKKPGKEEKVYKGKKPHKCRVCYKRFFTPHRKAEHEKQCSKK